MRQITDKSLADTGERMIPAHHKGNKLWQTSYGEHVIRYEAVLPIVKGKTVLDVASGSGYGSALMAQTAKKVIGVDVMQDAVEYAKKNYKAGNVEFLQGDGTALPLDDASVDIVACFETIEHIENYKKFLSEIKRVLKKDGLLILSTPNDDEFIEGNHFHIHQFKHKELVGLAKRYFSNVDEYFQATWLYNALFNKDELTKEWRSSIDTIQLAPARLERTLCFFLLCANRDIKEKIPPIGAMSEHWSLRDSRTKELKAAELQNSLQVARQAQAQLEGELRRIGEELARTGAELNDIKRSKAWRLASGVQKVSGTLRRVKQSNGRQ